jgi:hypothetical protein
MGTVKLPWCGGVSTFSFSSSRLTSLVLGDRVACDSYARRWLIK